MKLLYVTLRKCKLGAVLITVAFCILSFATSIQHESASNISLLELCWPALIASVVIPVFLTLTVFSHLRSTSEYDLYGAIPFTALHRYLACILTSLALSLVSVALVFAIPTFTVVIQNGANIHSAVLLRGFLAIIVTTVLFCACTALGCVTCRSISGILITTFSVMYAPFFVVLTAQSIYKELSVFFTGIAETFNIQYLILFMFRWGNYVIKDPERITPVYTLILYIVCSLILFVISYHLYKRRGILENRYLFSLTPPVISATWALSAVYYVVCCCFVLKTNAEFFYFFNSLSDAVITLTVGIPLLYFVLERVLRGRRRGFLKALGVLILMAVIAAITVAVMLLVSGR